MADDLLDFEMLHYTSTNKKYPFILKSSGGSISVLGKDDANFNFSAEDEVSVYSKSSNILITGKKVKVDASEKKKVQVQGKAPALKGTPFKDPSNIGCMHMCVHVFVPKVPPTPPVTYATCWLKPEGKINDGSNDVTIKGTAVGLANKSSIKYDDHKPTPQNNPSYSDTYKGMINALNLTHTESPSGNSFLNPVQDTVQSAITTIGASTSVFFEDKPVALQDNQNVVLSDSRLTLLVIDKDQ